MTTMLDLSATRQESLAKLVGAWLSQRGVGEDAPVVVREVEVLVPGRPGLLDVLAEVADRTAHVVFGLHAPGADPHAVGGGDDPVLGQFTDDSGLALVVDALRDTELAPLVLSTVTGDPAPETVSAVSSDDSGVVLAFADGRSLTVFPWVTGGPHPGVEMLVALDEAGFNHLAAPVALWRRGGRDLGLVQELLVGSVAGWALALTSLRDFFGAGGAPEDAGGDFAFEARSLGTMTARMHLALDRAFGRRSGSIADWAAAARAAVEVHDPGLLRAPGALETLRVLGRIDARGSVIRTHGDFHLGRTARTDQGWVVADCLPAGYAAGSDEPQWRSPLGDVADMAWSFHHAAATAISERDALGRSEFVALAAAWEARNRRAFLAGYLATAGIGALVPTDREVVRDLVAVLELQRAAIRTAAAGR
jgi:predicted trehalose synthase